jgi:hypothetical protein
MKNNKIQKIILAVVLCSAMSFVRNSEANPAPFTEFVLPGVVFVGGLIGVLKGYEAYVKVKAPEDYNASNKLAYYGKKMRAIGCISVSGLLSICCACKFYEILTQK